MSVAITYSATRRVNDQIVTILLDENDIAEVFDQDNQGILGIDGDIITHVSPSLKLSERVALFNAIDQERETFATQIDLLG